MSRLVFSSVAFIFLTGHEESDSALCVCHSISDVEWKKKPQHKRTKKTDKLAFTNRNCRAFPNLTLHQDFHFHTKTSWLFARQNLKLCCRCSPGRSRLRFPPPPGCTASRTHASLTLNASTTSNPGPAKLLNRGAFYTQFSTGVNRCEMKSL